MSESENSGRQSGASGPSDPTADNDRQAQYRASGRPNLRGEHSAHRVRSAQSSGQSSARAYDPRPTSVPSVRRVSAGRHVSAGQRRRDAHLSNRRSRRSSSGGRRLFPTATRGNTDGTRHSKRRFEAFPSVVGWTSLGTALPGLALIRDNRRSKIGWTLLIGFIVGILLILGYVAVRGPVKATAKLISSPGLLSAISIILIVGIIIWAFVIIRSYFVSRRNARMNGTQKALSGVLIASLLLIIGIPLGVGAAYAHMSGQTVREVFGSGDGASADKEELWPNGERINVFLIGRDSGDGRVGTRPDTMLVASINTATAETTLISVPRNLAFPHFPKGTKLAERFPTGFDAYGSQESLINAVWTWSSENPTEVDDPGDLEVGMFATMQAVEGSLGLDLNYWAAVDMKGFEDLIDAMGGVDIDVERPIPVGGGTNLNTGLKNEIYDWINPGQQTLNGKQALWYARSREGSDNYDRMCRQQRLIKTTVSQMNPQELALKFPELANSTTKNVASSINQTELGAFVELAWDMKNTKIKSAQINNEVVNTGDPNYTTLQKWVQEQINPKADSQAEEKAKDASTQEPSESPTTKGAPAPGIETDDGKCYPKDYVPGSGWPGWPGDSTAAAQDQ